MQVKPLHPGLLDALARLEAASYPGLSEPPQTLLDKLTLFPPGALGLFAGDTLLGYPCVCRGGATRWCA
jgi:hypothetical protein